MERPSVLKIVTRLEMLLEIRWMTRRQIPSLNTTHGKPQWDRPVAGQNMEGARGALVSTGSSGALVIRSFPANFTFAIRGAR